MADDMRMTSFKANMGASVASEVHAGLAAQGHLIGVGQPSPLSISPETITSIVSTVLTEVVTLYGPQIETDVVALTPEIRTVLSEATIEFLAGLLASLNQSIPAPSPNPVIPGGGPVAEPRG
jgi:hypothetical protein